MNEELPLGPTLIAVVGLAFFGYEVEQRRHKLREVFNVFDRHESIVADTLEQMVESGELRPYAPPSRS